MDQKSIMMALEWAYKQAINGAPGLSSAEELGNNYINKDGSTRDNVNRLIRWQNAKCITSGFISGLGGLITMPVAIPANISSVIFVQIRMIAAIAYMGGYNLNDDKVRTLVFVCLCGNAAKDILKEIGIQIGKKLTEQAIKKLSFEVVKNINQTIGFRLLTKFGEKGVINLGKAIPFVGGVIGGTMDLIATNQIGNIARDTFTKK